MPANLTDVDAFTSPVVVPVDGDTRNAASVQTGFQALADRTRWAKNKLDAGAVKIANVANLAALTALTGMADKDVRLVISTLPGAGTGLGEIYYYEAGSSTTADGYQVVTSASGRWFLTGSAQLSIDVAHSNERRSVWLPPNRLAYKLLAETAAGTFNAWTGTFGPTQNFSGLDDLRAGDKVLLEAGFSVNNNASTTAYTVSFEVNGVEIATSVRNFYGDSASVILPVHMATLYTVPSDGAYLFKIRYGSAPGVPAAQVLAPIQLITTVTRP